MELIVFLITGKTLYFSDVENLTPTTQGFSFGYVGKATGVKRRVEMNYTSVAGYAVASKG